MTTPENKSLFTEITEEESATVSGGIDLTGIVSVVLPTATGTGSIVLGANLQTLKDSLNQQQDSNGVPLGDSILNQLSALKALGKL